MERWKESAGMARSKKTPPAAPPPATGFTAPPSDGGLSIDKLAQAFAAMMGAPDPHATAEPEADVVHVDASPDLDDAGDDDAAASRFRAARWRG